MDITIRGLDERTYQALKARAALTGRTIGETLSEAIRVYLARPRHHLRSSSLADLRPLAFPEGTDELSRQVDEVVYGTQSFRS